MYSVHDYVERKELLKQKQILKMLSSLNLFDKEAGVTLGNVCMFTAE